MYSGKAVSAIKVGSLLLVFGLVVEEEEGAVAVLLSARVRSAIVDAVLRRRCCSSARMPAQVAFWRSAKARADRRAWRPSGWMVTDGEMASVRRWRRRVGKLDCVLVGWARRKEERRVEGIEPLGLLLGPVVARLADDEAVEGRVDVWARASRLEEEADGN